mmetsp:Transcript_20004/g.29667  ORF Transcript_20004/g.29667 Transcript_20004/m.29667 type:complete len:109 (-) Transcript_20004:109-435(-)
MRALMGLVPPLHSYCSTSRRESLPHCNMQTSSQNQQHRRDRRVRCATLRIRCEQEKPVDEVVSNLHHERSMGVLSNDGRGPSKDSMRKDKMMDCVSCCDLTMSLLLPS